MKKIYKDIAVFVGGTLFGSAGIKLLSSKDAKNVYTHAAAAVLRMKDTVMNTVDCVKENAGDILASAEEINEKRAAEAEAAAVEDADTPPADQPAPASCGTASCAREAVRGFRVQ